MSFYSRSGAGCPHGGVVGPCMSLFTTSFHCEYITCSVHLACIKLSSTEMKCKCSNKASCMTHPVPFFFLTSSLPALCTLFCLHAQPPHSSSSFTGHSTDQRANSRGRHGRHSLRTNQFLTQASFESPSESSNRAT